MRHFCTCTLEDYHNCKEVGCGKVYYDGHIECNTHPPTVLIKHEEVMDGLIELVFFCAYCQKERKKLCDYITADKYINHGK